MRSRATTHSRRRCKSRLEWGWGPWGALALDRVCDWAMRPGRREAAASGGVFPCLQSMPFDERRRHRFDRRRRPRAVDPVATARARAPTARTRTKASSSSWRGTTPRPSRSRCASRSRRSAACDSAICSADLITRSRGRFRARPGSGTASCSWPRRRCSGRCTLRGAGRAFARVPARAPAQRPHGLGQPGVPELPLRRRAMQIQSIEVFPVRLPMKAVLTLPRGPVAHARRRQARRLGQDHRPRRPRRLGRVGAVAALVGRDARIVRHVDPRLPRAVPDRPRRVRPRGSARDDEPRARGRPRPRPADREVRDRRRGPRPDRPSARHPAAELARREARRPGHAVASDLRGDARRGSPQPRAEAVAEGYVGFKVKVGHLKALDADIVRAVVEAAPGAFVWADANQGCTLDEALRLSRGFREARHHVCSSSRCR